MGFRNKPISGKEASDVPHKPRMISATITISETSVSSGWRVAVQQRALGGGRDASVAREWHILEGQNLFAAGHAVGLSGAGLECGPFVPRCRRPLDCSSHFARTKSVLCRNRCLLSGQKAAA